MIVNCPKCNKKTALSNDTCEHCGIRVKSCPECGNIMEETQIVCDYCGYSFESIKAEEKVEKNTDEVPKELKKTAVKLASFAEKVNKKYNLISKILSPIGWIICLIAIVIPLITINTKDVQLYTIKSSFTLHKVFLVFGIIIIFVGCLFKELRTIFGSPTIIRRMEALKFDYKKYYLYDNVYKNITEAVLNEDIGDLQLVKAIEYKESPSKKTTKLLKQLILLFCYVLTGIFGYIGMTHVMDVVLTSFLLSTPFDFKVMLNIWFILCVAFYILSLILHGVFNKDEEEAGEWIEQLRKREK